MALNPASNDRLPLVSVVIPAYNCADYINEAIESALAQTYPNVEIIVVDDGSSDETVAIVRMHPQVRLFQQPNQGSAVARNRGVQEAAGSFIAFLDSDDYWWSGKLDLQMKAMQDSGLDMAYSRFIWWHPDEQGSYPPAKDEFEKKNNSNISTAKIHTGWTYADLLLDCIVWTSTVVVRKELIEKAGGFDPNYRKGQDYDLWLKLSRLTPMIGIEKPTALYRIHNQSITHKVSERCYEYEIVFSASNKWGISNPDGRSLTLATFR